MSKKTDLLNLTKTATEKVVAVEALPEGASFAGPATEAREAAAQLRQESRGPLFPDAVTPLSPGLLEAWAAYSENYAYTTSYGAAAAALHAASLRSFGSLAEFARGPIVRARVRRAGANGAVPATEATTPGAPVRQIETAAEAAARAADAAEQEYEEACARQILAAQGVPAVADLLQAAEAFVAACDLGKRLAATLVPREAQAKAEAARIEAAALAAEQALLEARRTSLVTFFEGLATAVFDQVTSVGGMAHTPGSVTGELIARALANGRLGAAGHADELERAEALRDQYRARVRREHERAERLAAAAATK